jgi:hypothetical protein
VDQLFTFCGGSQQNGSTVLIRGLATDQAQTLEPVEVFAARGRRHAETPCELTYLEVGVRRDEFQKTELRSGETAPADPVEKTFLEELSQEGSQNVSGAQEAIEVIARRIRIPEKRSRFFTSIADWHNSPG